MNSDSFMYCIGIGIMMVLWCYCIWGMGSQWLFQENEKSKMYYTYMSNICIAKNTSYRNLGTSQRNKKIIFEFIKSVIISGGG